MPSYPSKIIITIIKIYQSNYWFYGTKSNWQIEKFFEFGPRRQGLVDNCTDSSYVEPPDKEKLRICCQTKEIRDYISFSSIFATSHQWEYPTSNINFDWQYG